MGDVPAHPPSPTPSELRLPPPLFAQTPRRNPNQTSHIEHRTSSSVRDILAKSPLLSSGFPLTKRFPLVHYAQTFTMTVTFIGSAFIRSGVDKAQSMDDVRLMDTDCLCRSFRSGPSHLARH
jgi:hypothetical protein